jgi:hypothetical protein
MLNRRIRRWCLQMGESIAESTVCLIFRYINTYGKMKPYLLVESSLRLAIDIPKSDEA